MIESFERHSGDATRLSTGCVTANTGKRSAFRSPTSGKRFALGFVVRLALLAVIAGGLLIACGPSQSSDGSGRRTVIQSKGSDTLVNVAQNWAEAYSAQNRDVAVAVSGGGTGTGIAGLVNGTTDIANASRAMDEKEMALAASRGRTPTEFIVGYDALAVYVHRANPLTEITLKQLADIYGELGTTVRWTQLGVEVPDCRDQKIIVVSRQNNSGTYEYFRSAVLGTGQDYRLGTLDLHGSKDVVDLVQRTPCAIGYSGLAYRTDTVKALGVRPNSAGECVTPTVDSAVDGSYPISRPLFMYTAEEPTGSIKDYIQWVLGNEGQCILVEKGYAPVRPVECP